MSGVPDLGGLPAVPEHERLHLAFLQASERLHSNVIQWCEVAATCIERKVHQHMGFENEIKYLEHYSGLRYRTVMRYLQIHQGIQRLPEGEREEAKQVLARLGSHKAATLAPTIGREGVDWREVARMAGAMREEALQERVSQLTGGKTRGITPPGEYALRSAIRKHLPPELHEELDAIFDAGRVLADSKNDIAVMVALLAEASHWKAAAEAIRRGGSQA